MYRLNKVAADGTVLVDQIAPDAAKAVASAQMGDFVVDGTRRIVASRLTDCFAIFKVAKVFVANATLLCHLNNCTSRLKS